MLLLWKLSCNGFLYSNLNLQNKHDIIYLRVRVIGAVSIAQGLTVSYFLKVKPMSLKTGFCENLSSGLLRLHWKRPLYNFYVLRVVFARKFSGYDADADVDVGPSADCRRLYVTGMEYNQGGFIPLVGRANFGDFLAYVDVPDLLLPQEGVASFYKIWRYHQVNVGNRKTQTTT